MEEIKLPSSINSIGESAFNKCKIKRIFISLDRNQIIPYTKDKFPTVDETVFKIPQGETENYFHKDYPLDRLEEEDLFTNIRNYNSNYYDWR